MPRARTLVVLLVAVGLTACGGQTPPTPEEASDPGPIHVHGLGVNPADGALFIATHTGLFRAGPTDERARRVGEREQDTMGFTVIGENRFLGSGHPDGREDLPPFLGLIESSDAGRTWRARSLQGEVDFHVLESDGSRVYGFGSDWETREPRFLSSDNGGGAWNRLVAPEPLLSLAISPENADSIVASGERTVFGSSNAGRAWTAVDSPGPGLLAWTRAGVSLVTLDGRVWHSGDPASGNWRPVGDVGGEPAAFDTGLQDELLVAMHDGVVKRSADGGRSWSIRSRP